MSEEPESVSAEASGQEGVTPDRLLHTGAVERPTAEDLVLASGRDLNPRNLEWARRRLAEDGRSAVDRLLP
ncbi:hypothetical protein EES43_01075 [Streptomyces sp. ADI96-02]|uniref:hypothetical protein n=1 Tax=unclassified Streptomyces TaxID=2593676 RepID=UPI000F5515BD|nr:hypothetical protein [Streptomyces sp. ADI96-02]RPK68784.1 hypothetical protein EES43_01075 [Streptomyces sp. ADI96-02]